MAKSLFEAYKNRLAVANTVYAKAHGGEAMSNHRKLVTAKVLENTNRFLNEAFNNSVGTQATDMGMWKKFALNLTTVAIPNLISHDLVIVHPMSSMSGYVTYIEYSYGSNKGETKQGDLISNPFGFGKVDAAYTGAKVVETIAEGQKELAWGPVIKGSVEKFVDGAWTVVEGDYTPVAGDKVRYEYDNVVIPQNDLPMVKAEVKSIALVAKARRIAVYYSQIAAFQAKTDYGVDLGDQLAEKAVGELAYEIDCEVIDRLAKLAATNEDSRTLPEFSRTLPVGVSRREHYAAFAEVIETAKDIIYSRTQKFAPNWMVCASSVLPILSMIDSFKAAPTTGVAGPYLAGTFGSLKVFISPRLEKDTYLIGCNGGDMMSAPMVYAPYMAVIPTQLLQYADGGNSQGFSTMYALEDLNKNLVVAGKITA